MTSLPAAIDSFSGRHYKLSMALFQGLMAGVPAISRRDDDETRGPELTRHPHQPRHTAGTLIRREFGLEAAQLALGHSSAKVTDAVYAERDMARVIEVMKRIG